MLTPECGLQMFNVFNQHIEMPSGNCHGEKICTTRKAVATIIGLCVRPDVTEDDTESDGLRSAVPVPCLLNRMGKRWVALPLHPSYAAILPQFPPDNLLHYGVGVRLFVDDLLDHFIKRIPVRFYPFEDSPERLVP